MAEPSFSRTRYAADLACSTAVVRDLCKYKSGVEPVTAYRLQCERDAIKRTLDAVEAARSEYELKTAIARMRQECDNG